MLTSLFSFNQEAIDRCTYERATFIVAFRSGRGISYCVLGPEGRQLPAGCASTRMATPHQFSGSVTRRSRETEPEN
ncbi:hypothetical protein LF1_33490 [Rubripirellula obstinata]|uniref:Uncharacterized protein n=1 Tax=Rubripirellula obstinata TaxID=406547 RepID=A0A5B1CHX9_9BACT|nr:hypothetical protein LF1_33490 [Rubripirellula obstinata]